ncbi:MAG: glycosyltransferase family 9 protein, partial [Flavobacteriales bacterium]
MSNAKHILVIRLSAMGDVAMTVPVLRALIEQHPQLKITVLT